jgi:hypothetical protein
MTPEQFETICARIESEAIGLREICEDAGADRTSFWKYLARTPGANDRYAHAKQLQAEILAAEILSIADTIQEGVKTVEKPTGTEVTTGDMIDHRRLRVDSRKWLLSKLLPKKYGDKLDLTTDGDKIKSSLVVNVVSTEGKDQIQRHLTEITTTGI